MIYQKNEWFDAIKAQYDAVGAPMKEINLVGIEDKEYQGSDVLNDLFALIIGTDVWVWRGTCDPGRNATLGKDGGAAHLVYGYQENIWVIDTHAPNVPSFKHEALCSRPEYGCNPTTVWRDVNRDFYYEEGTDKIQSGYFGVNFHRASVQQDINAIGEYSYGCQVTRSVKDFNAIMAKIKSHPAVVKNPKYKFSYLLIPAEKFPFSIKQYIGG